MTNQDELVSKQTEIVRNDLINTESDFGKLRFLVHYFKLEKELFNLVKYESVSFIPINDQVKLIGNPTFERISMVYPFSYSFEAEFNISGYFMVKRSANSDALPVYTEPFRITYSGILLPVEDTFVIKNENLELVAK